MINKRMEQERLGEVGRNKNGSIMKIVKYDGWHEIYVKFEQGESIKTNYGNFLKGKVKNPFEKSVYRIGYLGQGKHKAYINSKKQTPQYIAWKSMLARCFSEKFKVTNKSYNNCTVVEEWHNFQNFAAWYDENYYEIEGTKMNLDKDILIKGNKMYSPETCVFVPDFINLLFIKCDLSRGKLPIGVSFEKRTNKYVAKCNSYLGTFKTPLEAFQAYKLYKEQLIKQVAEEYKDNIPKKLYDAMYTYEVEITD